ncbi:glycerate kinase [Acidovorax temperans]|uniref:glycerate kinase n=1 Tax=Acidovorax temperans TaxID=80878 RepID=UPI001A94F5FD|nr:glycerate kinase [Acidovorax temperans]MBO0944003.1 glycerate kinase [Acidovorax temperans]
MNLRNIFVPAGVIGLVLVGYASAGWPGVAAVVGGLVMWALLHFTRLMNVMKKAANRPMGYVGSAVMLNARLKPGVNLMHVMAMTQSLGERLSAENAQPEVYRWTDGTRSHVTCEFANGRLQKWTLERPQAEAEAE